MSRWSRRAYDRRVGGAGSAVTLRHDSFDADDATFASGAAKKTPMPRPLRPGTMIAQRYGIGGKPWTSAPGRNGQLAWKLRDYFTSIGRPDSPANAPDLNERSADAFYSIGAPYVALASDWLPIATNWTGLMPMAVARSFGNLAEMYAMVIAVADLGIRPATVDSLMVSNVGAGGEGWPFVDRLPPERACDPTLLDDEAHRLPFFLRGAARLSTIPLPRHRRSNSPVDSAGTTASATSTSRSRPTTSRTGSTPSTRCRTRSCTARPGRTTWRASARRRRPRGSACASTRTASCRSRPRRSTPQRLPERAAARACATSGPSARRRGGRTSRRATTGAGSARRIKFSCHVTVITSAWPGPCGGASRRWRQSSSHLLTAGMST